MKHWLNLRRFWSQIKGDPDLNLEAQIKVQRHLTLSTTKRDRRHWEVLMDELLTAMPPSDKRVI